MNDWQSVMQEAGFIATLHGVEFHELRNTWGALMVAQDADFYAGHGVTSSDMNHMLYGAMKSDRDAVEQLAERLGSDKRKRDAIVADIAKVSGQHPTLVLQQLREFFAPVE